MEQTMAEFQREEAKREGLKLAQSMAQEIAVKAVRQALTSVLTARFGELPTTISQTIEGAEANRLQAWIVIAATASSLEAVGIETKQ